MVFLRLRVKVYPREQVAPTPSFSFRAILGDRDRDDASRSTNGSTAGKPATFLLVLEKPEEITMGGLAGLIQEKWKKLRPKADPLDIKKLLDDNHEADDLDADMTVAEVFVDNGRARQDSSDQRATVRVMQKPGQYAPVRFPSVTQDWDAAAQNFERQIQIKKEAVKAAMDQIPTIAEEENIDFSNSESASRPSSAWGSYENRRSEIPVSSVEKDEVPGSPAPWEKKSHVHEEDSQDQTGSTIAATPLQKRMVSQELGDSPAHSPTPKAQSASSRHGSSQGSARRPIVKEATEAKPSATREVGSADGSLSPLSIRQPLQRRHVHEPQPPIPVVVESGESEDEESDENDENVEPQPAAEDQPRNGDVVMHDAGATAMQEAHQSNNSSSRKRKLTPDIFEPSKEPRLAKPASTQNGDQAAEKSIVTPEVSPPTPRKRVRAPSFGFGRRLPFSGRAPSEPPKPGLGLGITKSPPNKRHIHLTQVSAIPAPPNFLPPNGTPEILSSSAPTLRRGSVSLPQFSTPSKLQTPIDKVKVLHSALRKSSPAERPSERRSVSFADEDEVLCTGSQPAPKSNPQSASKVRAKATDTNRRTSDSSSMVFPASVPKERLDQLLEEANRKVEQDKRFEEEFKAKIKTAREQKADPQYIRKLTEMSNAWTAYKKAEKEGRQAKLETHRIKFESQRREVEKLEASLKTTKPAPVSPKPRPLTNGQGSQKSTPRSHPDEVSIVVPTPQSAKAANGPKSTPASTGKTTQVQARTRPISKATASPKTVASEPPQSSLASDGLDLPPMGRTVYRAGSAKPNGTPVRPTPVKSPQQAKPAIQAKPPPQAPVEVSSDSDSSSESESESESESGSGSGSEDEPISKPSPRKTASSPTKANSTTPAELPASQPAPQTWARPSSATRTTRTTLKSLIQHQKKELEAKTQPRRAANSQPRKRNMFSPPSDSEDESESESESSSSDSDSDSD
ncbi:hypothetical protein BO78DRAFT_381837 [Aspergillus sclerotiicarbonarius CBS 121057]|uniref:Nucleolar protein Dnt1-like N-terminal domain-containing protein n=1 Tax=Aspergillus sclerotiicarbonarius (strain CBS 121057 / IBT 28362) TaxID=1448318 RepID=A0A319EW27_ASPSB|nr:hypothetical protein BO78DRAFT_381837 [Aspergillus sclerotiicarbonarius CBS 121057]